MSGSCKQVLLTTTGDSLTCSPPMGLLQLAACIRTAGVKVQIFDLVARPDKKVQFLEAIGSDTLWIGFSASTANYPSARRLAHELVQQGTGVPLILGGAHATVLPNECLDDGPWDAVAIGEGEEISVEVSRRLLERETLSGVPGLRIRREEGQVEVEAQRAEKLDALPMPAWDLVDLADYQSKPWQLVRRGKRVAPLMTSRGCPFQCSFCAVPRIAGRRIRLRPVEQVLEEAEVLVRQYGVDEFHIVDDSFNANLDHAKTIMQGLLEQSIRVFWKTPNGIRVDRCDAEFIDLVGRSGGYQVGFGIESADPGVLKQCAKPLDLEDASRVIEAFSHAGISTFGFFILGLPGETRDTIDTTIDYSVHSVLDHIHATLAVPYPGSPLFDRLKEEGKLNTSWETFRHGRAFPTCDLSPGLLRAALRRFYLRFYASPRRALGLARECLRSGLGSFARVAWTYLNAERSQR